MNKKKNIALFILIFILTGFITLSSQETKLIGNYIKLTVNNDDGRFLLYGRNSINNDWIPLLFEDNPSTTFFRFFTSQFQVPFGEEGIGRNSDIEIINDKIHYMWNNSRIKYDIEYELVSMNNSNYANTLIIDLKINNMKNTNFNFDYFFCIDTYLGESSKSHFILPDNEMITSEYEAKNPSLITSILSYDTEKDIGLNILFGNKNQIIPDRIYFSNWKRVEKNIGLYKIIGKRSFDLKPYSINDSAVTLEYLNQNIEAEKSAAYRFIITLKNNIAPNDKDAINPDEKEDVKGITEKDNNSDFDNIKPTQSNLNNYNFSELLEYLDKLNNKLKTKDPLLQEEIDVYNSLLEEIKNRKTK